VIAPGKRHVRVLAAGTAILLLGLGVVLRAVRPAAGATPGTSNVQVTHDGFREHAETGIAVNPRNSRDILGVALYFNTSPTPGTFSSLDGGKTWHDNGPLPLPHHASGGDNASVAFDTHGTGFVVAGSMTANSNNRGIYLWRTADGGRTFSRPATVVSGEFVDHPWLAIDPTPRAAGGDLYVAWVTRHASRHGTEEGVAFSRSTNHGRSFRRQQMIAAPAGGITAPVAAAGPSGAVYVAYFTVTSGHGEMQIVTSTNHGRSFGHPRTLGPADFGVTPEADLALPSGAMLAVDNRNGTAYVTYAMKDTQGRDDVVLMRSQDRGRTWSKSTAVTAAALFAGAAAFQPEVAVDGHGTVGVFYLVLVNPRKAEAFLTLSEDRGESFSPAESVSTQPFDPTLSLPGNKEGIWWVGDYQSLAAGPSTMYPCWGDTRTGRMQIYSATLGATPSS
jgi:hypothetical protein